MTSLTYKDTKIMPEPQRAALESALGCPQVVLVLKKRKEGKEREQTCVCTENALVRLDVAAFRGAGEVTGPHQRVFPEAIIQRSLGHRAF